MCACAKANEKYGIDTCISHGYIDYTTFYYCTAQGASAPALLAMVRLLQMTNCRF